MEREKPKFKVSQLFRLYFRRPQAKALTRTGEAGFHGDQTTTDATATPFAEETKDFSTGTVS